MLSAEIIQQVRQLQIHTARQVADVLSGAYMSVFRGRGVEFDEVRPYVPGDDVRSIDWNVTARAGEPFVKRYMEERELTLLLVVDISASQDFGSQARSKREAAVELSALLAFSAIQSGDQVGALLFHSGPEVFIPPRRGQKHALRVVREVLAHGRGRSGEEARKEWWGWMPEWMQGAFRKLRGAAKAAAPGAQGAAQRGTNLAVAMEFCRRVLKRKAIVFLISDMMDEDYVTALKAASRRHDVIAVHVSDPREHAVTGVGLLTLQDAETGQVRVVDTSSARFREATAATMTAHWEGVEASLRAAGVDLVRVDVTQPVLDPLARFFRMRQRRGGRR